MARATSLVRDAPASRLAPHEHAPGEEILALEGLFSDAQGHYPAGGWLRGPHLSRHRPFSDRGCVIHGKVGHLDPDSVR